jgi:hypothetical protein
VIGGYFSAVPAQLGKQRITASGLGYWKNTSEMRSEGLASGGGTATRCKVDTQRSFDRGGTVTVIQGQNGTTVINHFGITTITNNVGTFTLSRSDFGALVQSLNSAIQDLGRIPPDVVAFHQAHTTSSPGENGGVTGFNGTNIGHCGFGALQGTNCPQTSWSPTTGGEYGATQILGNATNFGTNQITPPPPPPRGPPCGNRC